MREFRTSYGQAHDRALAGLAFLTGGALALFALLAGAIWLSLRRARTWTPPGAVAGWVRTLGLVTYPYYLVHEILGGFVLHTALAQGLGPRAGLLVAMAAIGVMAWLIAHHGEPLLRRSIERAAGWNAGGARAAKGA